MKSITKNISYTLGRKNKFEGYGSYLALKFFEKEKEIFEIYLDVGIFSIQIKSNIIQPESKFFIKLQQKIKTDDFFHCIFEKPLISINDKQSRAESFAIFYSLLNLCITVTKQIDGEIKLRNVDI